MTKFHHFLKAGWIAASLSLAATSLQAVNLNLSEVDGYNLVTWGDGVLKNSDTKGRAAIGGNAIFNGASIGTGAPLANPLDGTLVVGGNLNAGNGQIYNGSIYVGGDYVGPGYNINSAGGSVTLGSLGRNNVPFNFDAAQASLMTKSTDWGALTPTGSSELLWSTLTLEGSDSSLNIFTIDAASLAAASAFEILIPAGAKALINVTGAIAEFGSMGISGTNTSENTLFNFYEATHLSITGVGVTGSILAPQADVNFLNGDVYGQLIANSYSGGQWSTGTLHNTNFSNDIEEATRVPDTSSTLALISIAIVGLIAVSRKLQA